MPPATRFPERIATYVAPSIARAVDKAAERAGLSRAAWTRTKLTEAVRAEARRVAAEAPPLTDDAVAVLRSAELPHESGPEAA
jgi:hypothetical protein